MARVLIVDDSPTEIHVLSGMLEKNGHQVDSGIMPRRELRARRKPSPNSSLWML